MREHKYRIWNEERELMSFFNLNNPATRTIFPVSSRLGKGILMQYTGLKDKNGKEIYEGDILYVRYGPDALGGKQGGQYKTVSWKVSGNKGRTGFNLSSAIKNNYEIIGNIYENPELIKKE